MHQDIAKAIELIEQRIAALQNIRDQLAREFGDQSERAQTQERSPRLAAVPPAVPTTLGGGNGDGRVSRRDQVAQFIREHGPATRSQIIEGTQIPTGTVAYCLNDESRFANRNGRWHLVQ